MRGVCSPILFLRPVREHGHFVQKETALGDDTTAVRHYLKNCHMEKRLEMFRVTSGGGSRSWKKTGSSRLVGQGGGVPQAAMSSPPAEMPTRKEDVRTRPSLPSRRRGSWTQEQMVRQAPRETLCSHRPAVHPWGLNSLKFRERLRR